MTRSTRHASRRAQQRGISKLAIDLVLDFGVSSRSYGASVYRLDKKGRKRLQSSIGSLAYKRLSDLLDVQVVLSDDEQLITVAHRR